ncbi:MAG: hypothetical protein CSA62_13135 [Planctomycetota bacterium]|nr:MAG: hypothetical protein CSA62_13135 [Planctomycetota bacterium]
MQGQASWLRHFACGLFALLLLSTSGLLAQARFQSRSAGPARFCIPGKGLGSVLVYQQGRVLGFGELVPLLHAAVGPLREFRGYVPKGGFRLGKPELRRAKRRPGLRGQRALPQIRIGASTHVFERAEGQLCPRLRLQARLQDLRVLGDAYLWPSGECELRLLLEFDEEGDEIPAALPVQWGSRQLWLVGARPEQARPCREIPLAGLGLRPGDAVVRTLLSSADPLRVDPSLRVWSPSPLRDLLGFGCMRRTVQELRALRKVARDLRALVQHLPVEEDPLHRGDHRRPTEDDEIWTHGEFDLGLGLELFAQEAQDTMLHARARDACLHLLGRDLLPASSLGEQGLRLPAVHGAEHGRGRAAAGHVFVEGALLHGLAGAERLLLERIFEVLDDLCEFASGRAGTAWYLRDVAWPLRQLATGLRVADRAAWRRGVKLLLVALRERWDEELRLFDFRGVRRGQDWELELWLWCGLVLPALDRLSELGVEGAGELRGQLVEAIAKLPKDGAGFATHYAATERGLITAASGKRRNLACAAWVLEGVLRRDRRFASRARRLERLLCRKLPSGQWDAASEAALLLRLDWLRPGLRALRR